MKKAGKQAIKRDSPAPVFKALGAYCDKVDEKDKGNAHNYRQVKPAHPVYKGDEILCIGLPVGGHHHAKLLEGLHRGYGTKAPKKHFSAIGKPPAQKTEKEA